MKGYGEKNPTEGEHLEDVVVGVRKILKCIIKKLYGVINWIDLAQDRNRWWIFVNAVMNLQVA
jgi:hypothetical protein